MTDISERLGLLYEVSRKLTTFTDLDELLRFATRRARELFDAEGCALLLHDPERDEFFFPISSQGESSRGAAARLAEIRFPADRGIAGWVLSHNEAALVEDTGKDPRFYEAVDRNTQMHTRSLLCAPLRTRTGPVGVVEVVNPAAKCLTRDHLDFLEALASDIAVAHENAALYERLRGEVVTLRKVCRIAGVGLVAAGLVIAAGVVFTLAALALPLSTLPSRPGIGLSAFLLVAGGALLSFGRARTIPQPARVHLK